MFLEPVNFTDVYFTTLARARFSASLSRSASVIDNF